MPGWGKSGTSRMKDFRTMGESAAMQPVHGARQRSYAARASGEGIVTLDARVVAPTLPSRRSLARPIDLPCRAASVRRLLWRKTLIGRCSATRGKNSTCLLCVDGEPVGAFGYLARIADSKTGVTLAKHLLTLLIGSHSTEPRLRLP